MTKINQADKEVAARLTVELIKSLAKAEDEGADEGMTIALIGAVIVKAVMMERAACAKVAKRYSSRPDDVAENIRIAILERGAP